MQGGDTIEHTLVSGNAVIQLAGETGKPGRQIAASTLDISLAEDGSTPTALVGREAAVSRTAFLRTGVRRRSAPTAERQR